MVPEKNEGCINKLFLMKQKYKQAIGNLLYSRPDILYYVSKASLKIS
jgi:hypothetical protein